MPKKTLLHAIGIGILTGLGAVPAQSSIVVPNGYETVEAPGLALWSLAPFDSRCQLLVGSGQLMGLTAPVTGIQLRRNGTDGDSTVGGKVHIRIWLSHTQTPPDRTSRTFANNRGPDHSLVFDQKVDLASTPPPTQAPAPFSVALRFRAPFAYRGGTLCIETTNTPVGNSKKGPWWPIDARVDRGSAGVVTPYGASCIPGMAGNPAGVESNSLTLGGTAAFYVNAPTNTTAAILFVGASNGRYGSRQLPLDLTPLGAPGCLLYASADAIVGAGLEALPLSHSLAVVHAGIPLQPHLSGAVIFCQWMIVSPGANPMGATFSNGVRATLGSIGPLQDIVWVGSPDLSAPKGSVIRGRAPVLRLDM